MARTQLVPVGPGTHLEVRTSGAGEPVLLVQTALAPDEVARLGQEPVVAGQHHVVDLRRRGYGSSSPADGPGSVTRDARDCLAVLRELDLGAAHVVGVSYSAAVALELLALAPEAVATLTVVEPPPVHGRGREAFLADNARLHGLVEEQGVTAALEEFSRILGGPSWLAERAQADHGFVETVERDAATFFASDVPALLGWRLDADRLARTTVPVLYLGGTDTHEWFRDMPEWVAGLVPDCETHLLPDAGHALVGTHTALVASLLADFLARHGADDPLVSRPGR